MFQSKRVRWSAAAAVAAAVVLVIGFWPGKAGRGPGNGIAWADVVQRIGAAKTMVCWGGHGTSLCRYRCFSEGDRCRLEQYAAGVEQRPTRIEVSPAVSTGWDSIAWSPSRKRLLRHAHRRVSIRVSSKTASVPLVEQPAEDRADQTRRAGEAELNGVPAVIFEASTQELFDGQPPAFEEQGTLRVWVSKRSGVPIQMELRHGGGSGNEVVETASEIQWDVPLSNELFQTPPFDDGWKVENSRTACFSESRWRGGLELGIGPRGGLPIATQNDLLGFRATERTTSAGTGPALTVTFELTDAKPVACRSTREPMWARY